MTIHSKSQLYHIDRTYRPRRATTQKQWVNSAYALHESREIRDTSVGSRKRCHLSLPDDCHYSNLRDCMRKESRIRKPIRQTIPGFSSHIHAIDCGSYSMRVRYTRWEYNAIIESWSYVSEHGSAVYWSAKLDNGTNRGSMRAPKGYRFSVDDGLLVVVRNACGTEFHPTALDLARGKSHLRTCVLESRRRRIDLERVAKRLQREKHLNDLRAIAEESRFQSALGTICVTEHDSRIAGNCDAGTREFIQRSRLSAGLNRSVSAAVLLRISKAQQVMRAVRVAWNRETTIQI